jgi:nitroreductase
MQKRMRMFLAVFCILLMSVVLCAAQDLKPIQLPKPAMDGGKPLMQTLKERHSSRAFSPEKLPLQVLANLLWAADGFNRPGKRTAPSAVNWQEVDIYVALSEGLFLYDAGANALKPVLARDVRAMTGRQSYVKDAPVNLIYVADFSKMKSMGMEASDADKRLYSAANTGFISQNVYLFCTSEGLATVVRGLIDRSALSKLMGLRAEQQIILAQSVGYAAK